MLALNGLLSFTSVMKSVGGIVLAVIILLAMVTIHEFGHYIAGKALGFKINEFAVGFGPALFKKRSKKTGELFAVRIIPLGGYCAFDGEDEFEEEGKPQEQAEPFEELKNGKNEQNDLPMSALNEEIREEYPEPKGERFNDQPPWKRIIVLVAGATMNYLLALALILTMFSFFGRPAYVVECMTTGKYEGMTQEQIQEGKDVLVGDTILEIDGKTVYMVTDYMSALQGKKQGESVEIVVLREGKKEKIQTVLKTDGEFKNMNDTNPIFDCLNLDGYVLYSTNAKEGFFQSIGQSFEYSVKIGGTILRSLGELLTGKLGMDAVGGPITTIQVTSEVATNGVVSFLNIASFIGVNLAVFNLLPIPALDGSKVVFCIIEWIRKKPVNRKVETMIHFVGIIFLFGFAILVDLLQLFF